MGKMVFMTFAEEKKKKVQVISVAQEPNKEKVDLGPTEPKPPSTWMKSKYKNQKCARSNSKLFIGALTVP
jgi:hypothetical protein